MLKLGEVGKRNNLTTEGCRMNPFLIGVMIPLQILYITFPLVITGLLIYIAVLLRRMNK